MNRKLVVAVGIGLLVGAGGSAWAAGDAAAGKGKAAVCTTCHGANGEGMAANPKIAGLKADHIVKQLKAFKSGERPNPTKKAMLGGTSDQDVEDLAAYFSSLK
jgi:cytochrome c553